MAATNPTKIVGRWREGVALDYHTVSSTFIGYNEFGYPMFDTERSELGELVYRLKSKRDESVIAELAETASNFVASWNPEVKVIVPVPPSRPRTRQPVFLIAEVLAGHLRIPVRNCIVRVKEVPELKNIDDLHKRIELLQGAYSVEQAVVEGQKVLLLDDLFRSGATMNAVAEALYKQGRAAEVFALAMTRTRSKT